MRLLFQYTFFPPPPPLEFNSLRPGLHQSACGDRLVVGVGGKERKKTEEDEEDCVFL